MKSFGTFAAHLMCTRRGSGIGCFTTFCIGTWGFLKRSSRSSLCVHAAWQVIDRRRYCVDSSRVDSTRRDPRKGKKGNTESWGLVFRARVSWQLGLGTFDGGHLLSSFTHSLCLWLSRMNLIRQPITSTLSVTPSTRPGLGRVHTSYHYFWAR